MGIRKGGSKIDSCGLCGGDGLWCTKASTWDIRLDLYLASTVEYFSIVLSHRTTASVASVVGLRPERVALLDYAVGPSTRGGSFSVHVTVVLDASADGFVEYDTTATRRASIDATSPAGLAVQLINRMHAAFADGTLGAALGVVVNELKALPVAHVQPIQPVSVTTLVSPPLSRPLSNAPLPQQSNSPTLGPVSAAREAQVRDPPVCPCVHVCVCDLMPVREVTATKIRTRATVSARSHAQTHTRTHM
jgi:hypothetical protein